MRFVRLLLLLSVLVGCGAPATQQRTSLQVVEAFKAAGLEAEDPRPIAREDLKAAPMVHQEATRFLIPSLCPDCGGRVFTFRSQADLERVRGYYTELGRASAAFYSHVFVRDLVLVQINGDLPDDKAKAYEAALMAMR